MPVSVDALRSRFRALSLSRKLTAMGILTSAASLAIAALVLVAYDRVETKADILSNQLLLADVIGNNSTAALAFGDAKSATETLRVVGINTHVVTAAILSMPHATCGGTSCRRAMTGSSRRAKTGKRNAWDMCRARRNSSRCRRPGSLELRDPRVLDGITLRAQDPGASRTA